MTDDPQTKLQDALRGLEDALQGYMADLLRQTLPGGLGGGFRPPFGADGPYQVLGVSPDAPWEEVRRAYHRRAKQAHPDLGGSKEEMGRVNRAYQEARRRRGKP